MVTKTQQQTQSKQDAKATRASVSFPPDLYEMLERLAKEQKVSVAWIVRDAAEKYVNEKWPLFGGKG